MPPRSRKPAEPVVVVEAASDEVPNHEVPQVEESVAEGSALSEVGPMLASYLAGTPMIHRAMLAAMRSIGAVAKRQRNEQQDFNFRGVDAVVNAVGPALRDAGIFLIPEVERLDYEPVSVERSRGDRTWLQHSIQVRAHVAYSFTAADGSTVTARVVGEAIDYGDKGVAKAMSVAYRILLLQVFSIPTDDPDPDSVVYQRSGGGEAPPAQGFERGRGRNPEDHRWETPLAPPAERSAQPAKPAAPPPPPPPEPYAGTDDDFAIDIANVEELGEAGLPMLRDLWRQASAAGRPDLADAVSRSVERIKQAIEKAPAPAEGEGASNG